MPRHGRVVFMHDRVLSQASKYVKKSCTIICLQIVKCNHKLPNIPKHTPPHQTLTLFFLTLSWFLSSLPNNQALIYERGSYYQGGEMPTKRMLKDDQQLQVRTPIYIHSSPQLENLIIYILRNM